MQTNEILCHQTNLLTVEHDDEAQLRQARRAEAEDVERRGKGAK